MFEFEKYEKSLHTEPVATPEAPYQAANDVVAMSMLVWGEHCVECAAPACYQTCDLYRKRPDGLCRRFTFGVYKNERFASLRGYGVEISFKKWAKLEARANTRMQPARSLLMTEGAIGLLAPLINAAGVVARAATGNARWSRLNRSFLEHLVERLRRRSDGPPPDAFLLEVYNPSSQPVRMQVSMTLDPSARPSQPGLAQIDPGFGATVAFPGGYSRHEFERRLFQSLMNSGLPFNIALTPEADNSARLVILTADFVSFRKRGATRQAMPQVKCVVWDLDNTLWDGVLIEDAEVKLKPEVVGLLRRFDERGILSSVASKNDHELAWERLERAGLGEYFLAPQINWLPKSQNIRHIAERLDIGLDTFAFVDDNPFELAEVARALPQVTTINAAEIAGTLDDPRFQGSASEDARQRRRYYQDAFRREEKREAFGANYLGFLADCEIQLEVRRYQPDDFERAAELAQRTNQLNFSGTKYTRQELAGLLEQDRFEKYLLDCSDRYGSYGAVGFSLVEHRTDEIRVEDLMLSCRAQGRFIEQAFFHYLQERHSPGRANRLWVNFRATPRNTPAQQVLEALHFTPCATGDGLRLDISEHSLDGHVISVRDAQVQGDRG
ncbi:MAG: HAD-IIIC family phosphatase [Acidobacteria bacterium]|nr:HAD-IIIC family phosphatase [Acidobacteriota bacterium]